MRFSAAFSLLLLFGATPSFPQSAPVAQTETAGKAFTDNLIKNNSYTFSLGGNRLEGRGADFLRSETKRAQFVLVGEYHDDRDVPAFASDLFLMLKTDAGFRYLAVEQDPIGTNRIEGPEFRGNVQRIAELSAHYPTLFGFSSDQDLTLLALASVGGTEAHPTVWGLEQVQGALLYLEELRRITPDLMRQALIDAFIQKARDIQPSRASPEWFLYRPEIHDELLSLRQQYAATPGSQADQLFQAMVTSSDIYAALRTAKRTKTSSLPANVLREELLRDNFIHAYRDAERQTPNPKVLLKMGQGHLYRGRGPTGAFTLGNFTHEFAASNGSEAFGIATLPFGGYMSWEQAPSFLKPVLPSTKPTQPVVIDLRPFRPVAATFATQLATEEERQDLLRFIHGYEVAVILPNSAKATWKLTGFPPL